MNLVKNFIKNSRIAASILLVAILFIHKHVDAQSNVDVAITHIASPLGLIHDGTNKTLSVRIRNVGNVAITSVKVGWKINGVAQTDVTLPIAIPIATNANQIPSAVFTLTNSYADILNNTVEIFIKEAQTQIDVNPLNDTIRATFGSPISGIKTIGKLNADYPSFDAAINAMRYNGVSGDLTFKVKAGTYNEAIDLNISEVYLPNGAKNFVFESASGNRDVILISEAAQQVTVKLTGIDNLNFRNIRIINRNIVTGIGIQLLSGANRVTISNCEITVDSISNTRGFAGILSGTIAAGPNYTLGTVAAARYLTLTNNKISGGYYGIAISGPNAGRDTGLVIEKNIINQVSYYGIYVNFSTNSIITRNNVTLRPSADLKSAGYYLTNITTSAPGNIQITRNYVSNAGQYGIYMNSVVGTGAPSNRYVNIYNNMIAGGFFNNYTNAVYNSAETPTGLFMNNCGWSNVYFNSVYMDAPTRTNTVDNTTAFYINGSSTGNGTTRIYNNVFSNANKGYAYYNAAAAATNPVILSDNNDLFSTLLDTGVIQTAGFAFWNGGARYNLRELTAASAKDRNSFSKDPLFFSTTDLHTLSADLNQKGSTIPLSESPFDYDGELRDQVNPPDVGCDEFGPGGEDFAIIGVSPDVFRFNKPTPWKISVRYQGPTNGNRTLYFGYKINGVDMVDQDNDPLFHQFTKLNSNFRSETFDVKPQFQINRSTYEPFKLTVYIFAGNVGDLRQFNDSITIDVCVGLEGTFTLDRNQPSSITNFSSFQEIYDYLKCGVSGPTIFEIADGTYDEQINLWKVRNSSATNNITFKSKNDVFSTKLTYVNGTAENHATVLFNNAQYIILRDLTIENRSLSNGTCIQLAGNSKFNEIRNNIIKLDSTLTPYPSTLIPIVASRLGTLSLATSYATNAQNNIIQNNKILGGYYGVAMYGQDSDKRDLGNIIEANTITSFHRAGIYLDFSDTKVKSNFLVGKFGMDPNAIGIHAKGLGDRLGAFTNEISGNRIYDISFQGILLQNCLGKKEPGAKKSTFVVSNNMIGGGFTTLLTTTSGLFLNTSTGISILFNTILMDAPRFSSTSVSKTVARCMVVNNTNDAIEAYNNILYSTNGAITLEYYTRTAGTGRTGLAASDYNLFYTTYGNKSTPLILLLRYTNTNQNQAANNETPTNGYFFSQLSQTPLNALGNFQKATFNSSREKRSIALPVLFEELPYDLHTYDLVVESKAVGGSDVLEDFDKNPRKSRTPDIGCDEFTVPNYDLEIRKINNQLLSSVKANTIQVEMRNRGRYSLKNEKVALRYTVSDLENNFSFTSIDTVTLNLSRPNDKQVYNFKIKASVPRRGNYEICVEKVLGWLPKDTVYYNDKKCVNICTGVEGNYYVGFDSSNPLPGTDVTRYYNTVQEALDNITCGIADRTFIFMNPANSPYLARTIIPKYLVNLDSPLLTILPYGTTDNSSVVMQQPASPIGDPDKTHFTVRFNGANFVKLQNITIKNTGASFGSAIHFTRSAKYNIVYGCKIEVDNVSNSALFYPIAFTSSNKLNITDNNSLGYNGSYNKIINNTIIGGYAGVALLGASTVRYDVENSIDSNIIQDFYQNGIYSLNNTIKSISFNKILPRNNTSVSSALISYNNAGEGGIINANTLQNSKLAAIRMIGIEGYVDKRMIISNNWFTHSFGNSVADTGGGIYMKRVSNIGIYYNSIRYNGNVAAINAGKDSISVPNPEGTGTIKEYFGVSNVHIKNNIIQVDSTVGATRKALAYRFEGIDPTGRIDHNAYFTGYKSAFAFYNPRTQRTFEIWQQNSAKDLTSISYTLSNILTKDSIFKTVFDLNLVDTGRLDKKGVVVEGVVRDFLNRKRSPRVTDIGSLEYERQDYNVSLFEIMNKYAKYGNNTYTVKVLNEGYKDLSNETVILEYSIDSGINWIGGQVVQLNELKGRYDEQLVSFNLKHNKPDFRSFTLCVRIAPNGRLQSDTTLRYETICKELCVGVDGGVFTIGKNGTETFTTIQNAINAITCGFDSSVVFKISPGTYTERVSVPAVATNPEKTVTFESADNNPKSVTITYLSTTEDNEHHIFQLYGARYITLRNLTFESKAKGRASAVHLTDTAKYNLIQNCIFNFDTLSTINTLVGVLSSGTIAFTDPGLAASNTIRNCTFNGGAFGIRLLGLKSNATVGPNKIISNTFKNSNTSAIDVFYCQIDSVTGNDIDMRKSNMDGVGMNIYGALTDFLIIGNKIKNARNIGMSIDSCRTISKGLIANNMIAGGFLSDGSKNEAGLLIKSTGAFPAKGIYSSGFIDIINNSVLYDGLNDSVAAFKIQISNSMNIYNNIFANYGNGYALDFNTDFVTVTEIFGCNTNLLFTKGTNLAKWKGTVCPTLSDLGLQDQGNAPFNIGRSPKGLGQFDPLFRSNYDLHVNNTMLDGAGTPSDLVTLDIDNEPRNTSTPDVGCDEYFPGFDIGVSEFITPLNNASFKDTVRVIVRIKNYGADINSIKVKYTFDGVVVDSATRILSPSLKLDSTTLVLFTKRFSTRQGGPHIIKAYTEIKRLNENNVFVNNDFNPLNDTATIIVISKDTSDIGVSYYQSPSNGLSIKQPTPVQIVVTNYGNLAANNFTINLKVNNQIKETLTINTPLKGKESKEYTFNYLIHPDSAVFFDVCAQTYLFDDLIESNDSNCIVILTLGVVESSAGNELFSVHPNPTSSMLHFGVDFGNTQDVTIDIYDLSGRLIRQDQLVGIPAGKQMIDMNYDELVEGTYLFVLTTGERRYNGRFVIIK